MTFLSVVAQACKKWGGEQGQMQESAISLIAVDLT